VFVDNRDIAENSFNVLTVVFSFSIATWVRHWGTGYINAYSQWVKYCVC